MCDRFNLKPDTDIESSVVGMMIAEQQSRQQQLAIIVKMMKKASMDLYQEGEGEFESV